ncbi:MAG: hypothetical protein WC364_04860 [Eubacteriales bacterium]|jgi:hypothetical protein
MERYLERVGYSTRNKLAGLLKVLLFNQLRMGKAARAAHVEVYLPENRDGENIRAVMVPDVQGFWVCETFLTDEEKYFY